MGNRVKKHQEHPFFLLTMLAVKCDEFVSLKSIGGTQGEVVIGSHHHRLERVTFSVRCVGHFSLQWWKDVENRWKVCLCRISNSTGHVIHNSRIINRENYYAQSEWKIVKWIFFLIFPLMFFRLFESLVCHPRKLKLIVIFSLQSRTAIAKPTDSEHFVCHSICLATRQTPIV